jgi:hypothetical protein
MVRYTVEQRVFLQNTYMKCGSARKCRRKFRCKFRHERLPKRPTIHNLVDKRRPTGETTRNKNISAECLLRKSQDDIGTRLEHTPRKPLKRLAQETGVS